MKHEMKKSDEVEVEVGAVDLYGEKIKAYATDRGEVLLDPFELLNFLEKIVAD